MVSTPRTAAGTRAEARRPAREPARVAGRPRLTRCTDPTRIGYALLNCPSVEANPTVTESTPEFDLNQWRRSVADIL
jgi:hypothetical protein